MSDSDNSVVHVARQKAKVRRPKPAKRKRVTHDLPAADSGEQETESKVKPKKKKAKTEPSFSAKWTKDEDIHVVDIAIDHEYHATTAKEKVQNAMAAEWKTKNYRMTPSTKKRAQALRIRDRLSKLQRVVFATYDEWKKKKKPVVDESSMSVSSASTDTDTTLESFMETTLKPHMYRFFIDMKSANLLRLYDVKCIGADGNGAKIVGKSKEEKDKIKKQRDEMKAKRVSAAKQMAAAKSGGSAVTGQNDSKKPVPISPMTALVKVESANLTGATVGGFRKVFRAIKDAIPVEVRKTIEEMLFSATLTPAESGAMTSIIAEAGNGPVSTETKQGLVETIGQYFDRGFFNRFRPKELGTE